MIEQFQKMWDAYIEHITTVTHHVELELPNTRPIHFVPYHAGSKDRQFKKAKIKSMLALKFVESASTKCTFSVEFVSEKYETLWFCVGYWTLNSVTINAWCTCQE